ALEGLPGLQARTTLQELRIVIADAIDDLGDLIERARPRSPQVPDAGFVALQEALEDVIQIVAVGARAHLVEVQRRGPAGTEARLDPVDRPRMVIVARAHRQRDAQDRCLGTLPR